MSETPSTPEKPKTKAQSVAAQAAERMQSVTPEPENDPNLVVNQADLVKPKTKYVYGNGTTVTNN